MALGSGIPALRQDYKIGRLCGRYFLATIGKLLAEKPPLVRHRAPSVPSIPAIPAANDIPTAAMTGILPGNDTLFNDKDLA